MSRKLVCLLGGSGFIGRALTRHLTGAGFSVRIPTRKRERIKKDLIVHPTVDVIEANIMDQSSLNRVTSGCDIVINLVGILNENKRVSFKKAHVELPKQIVAACQNNNISRLIHVSALGVSENAPSKYLKSKWQGEKEVKNLEENNTEVTILRPSVVFGNEDSFTNLFLKVMTVFPVLPLVKPTSLIQPIFVEDLAEAVLTILESCGQAGNTYELGGPKIYTLQKILKIICASQNKQRLIVPLPDFASRSIASLMEMMPLKILTRDNLLSLSIENTTTQNFSKLFKLEPESLESYLQKKGETFDQHNRKAKRRGYANR